MTTGIIDHLVNKQAEAGRILAACACINPAHALDQLQGVNLALIQDQQARAYLEGLATRRAQFDQADQLDQVEIAVRLAWDLGIQGDMLDWQGRAITTGIERGMGSLELIGETLTTIYRLVIARNEIQNLLRRAYV